MQFPSKHGVVSPQVEHLVVSILLSGERPRSISELRTRTGYERQDIIEAVESLEGARVVILEGEQVRPTPAAERIDALGMICGWAT